MFPRNAKASPPSRKEDYVIAGNLMWDAGTGFCEQRPDRDQDAHIKSCARSNRAAGHVVRNNLFAGAADGRSAGRQGRVPPERSRPREPRGRAVTFYSKLIAWMST